MIGQINNAIFNFVKLVSTTKFNLVKAYCAS